ncbi:MAG: alpha/beta fold hydrolase [Actinomycetales bacterium]|nr:alpha/beta fold hydrolase [Actinomycetales bacterium]
MNAPLTRGSRVFGELTGHDPETTLATIHRQSPQMHDWLLRGAFSQPLADPRLAGRDRELATVAMLTALGDTAPQLRVHLDAALHHGVTADELRALVEHASVYAGFPRALNALSTLGGLLHERDSAWPVPARRVDLSDHSTELSQVGNTGPAVVLLHALGLSWHMWEPVIRDLADGRRVYAYDLRGHGSAAEAPVPADLTTLADDVRAVLDHEGLSGAHVVGLSYGGAVAQTFAVRHRESVLSLTLAATTDRAFPSFERRASAVETDGPAAQVASSLTRWFTPEALAENSPGVRYARDRVLRGDPVQVAAAWRAFSRIDVEGKLRGLGRPALLLCGERDASTGPEVMRPMTARIPGSSYVELPGAPHMPTLETPHLVAQALDEFLPRVDAAPTGTRTPPHRAQL